MSMLKNYIKNWVKLGCEKQPTYRCMAGLVLSSECLAMCTTDSKHIFTICLNGGNFHYSYKKVETTAQTENFSTLVGMRTGPFTFRFFSLAPRIRSAQTENDKTKQNF